MIERNIYFIEEYHSLLVSWDPYSHAKTHFLVHELSFIFVVFKVAVSKEGLHLSPQGCRDQEGAHTNNKYVYLICLFSVINHIYFFSFMFHDFHIDLYS